MKLKIVTAIVAALCSTVVSAAEIWRCDTQNGKRYTSSQNVPSDSCVRDIHAELAAEQQVAGEQEDSGARTLPLFCKDRKSASCTSIRSDQELGNLAGVDYSLYRDSAVIAAFKNGDLSPGSFDSQWMVSCTRDKMTNARSCAVNRKDLYVFFGKNGSTLVSIGSEHYPGSLTSIKVGQRRFDTKHSDGNFAQSGQILGLLKGDAPIVTRYMKWPYRTWVDEELTSYGFQEAAQIARWLLVNGKLD